MNFCKSICDHLGTYKVQVLGVEKLGIFPYRGREVRKTHILPISGTGKRGQLNILPYRDVRFFERDYSKIKYHQFFHHLNSSQALCLNLFYPLIEENRLGLLTEFLKIESTGPLKGAFETQSQIEQAVR